MNTNARLQAIRRSGIRRIMEAAAARDGVVRLEIGDPDLPTPAHVIDAADRAARDGHTHYGPTQGLHPLREALAEKVARVNGHRPAPDQIVVTQGATQGLHLALTVLLNAGDEILIPEPAWPTYRMMAEALGLVTVPYGLDAATRYEPDLETLERRISPRTRALIVNSPSNPLGAVLDREVIEQLTAFAVRHGLWIVSDECYDEIVFSGHAASPASVASERTIAAYSFSKTYSMTGWRLGYLVVPPPVVDSFVGCQEAVLACVSTLTQRAGLAALTGPQDGVGRMRDVYKQRRDLVTAEAGPLLPGVRPRGAFFAWLTMPPGRTGVGDRAMHLLEEHGVAVAPGETFGQRTGIDHIRISMTAPEEDLRTGVRAVRECAAGCLTW